MSNYKLINPYIEGDIGNSFNGRNPLDAAVNAWNTLSKYMTNNVPKFAFSLEGSDDGKFYHFIVKESLEGGDVVDYKISEMDLEMKPNELKAFKNKIKKISSRKQSGGKKHHKKDSKDDDSSSSSSTSSSEGLSYLKLYKTLTKPQPIYYWWYDPLVYKFDSVYIPSFVAPLTPYIEVSTINYYPY